MKGKLQRIFLIPFYLIFVVANVTMAAEKKMQLSNTVASESFKNSQASIIPDKEKKYSWISKSTQAVDSDIDLNKVSEIAKDKKTVEDFLRELFSKYPELKDQFTLVYDSKSLQFASIDSPRVILFSTNGFIMTYTGQPGRKASNNIEIIAFDHSTEEFKFHEIIFEPNGTSVISENPKSCLACHGNRPIWNEYRRWDGVYGSFDDNTKTQNPNGIPKGELDNLRNFITDGSKGDRYKFLNLTEDAYYFGEGIKGIYPYTKQRRNLVLTLILKFYDYLRSFSDLKTKLNTWNISFSKSTTSDAGVDGSLNMAIEQSQINLNDLQPYYSGGLPKTGPNGNNNIYYDARNLFVPEKLKSNPKIRPVIVRCLDCHGGSTRWPYENAPKISFDRPHELMKDKPALLKLCRKVLKRTSVASAGTDLQMPPRNFQAALDEEDRNALIEYFKTLLNQENESEINCSEE